MLQWGALFDTKGVPEDIRLEGYLSAINFTLDTEPLTFPLEADLRACAIDDYNLIILRSSPRRSSRTIAQIRKDRLDTICFQYILSGSAIGRTSSRSIESAPGTTLVLDLSQPFIMTDAEERTVLNLAVPRAQVALHVSDPAELHGLILTADQSQFLSPFLISLPARLNGLPVNASATIARILDGLVELTLTAFCDAGEPILASAPSKPSDRATALIDSRIASTELTPEWLASQLSISRSQLYAMFPESGGVARYIWRRRLERSRQALADPSDNRRIGVIAYACGFTSMSHFTRAFKDAFGSTPSVYRRSWQMSHA